MTYDFDEVLERRDTGSIKWQQYPADVLPMWVADMDFRSPAAVTRALLERAAHPVYGYPSDSPELREVIVERMARLYGWQIVPEAIVFVAGVVNGINLAAQAVGAPGDGVLVTTPAYTPFLHVAHNTGRELHTAELARLPDGHYEMDFEALDEAITGRTRLFFSCNPHNPTGRVFRRDELERLAEISLRHGLVICSDEIHCDLLYRGQRHIPIATLAPEVAEHTITYIAPSKTFNVAGLACSLAIVPNPELRARLQATLTTLVNVMGFAAALAAYRDGQPWLDELLAYLEANRDFAYQYVNEQLPGVRMGLPQGTYLAWLDCREAGIPGSPYQFFLDRAHVAVSDGAIFGRGGEGFVRLNFGCRRAMLLEALERMRAALRALP